MNTTANSHVRGRWLDILSSLPESGFFELVRHYLGPVRTPFHKPEIMNRLTSFMTRREVLDRSARYLDSTDALYLSIIMLSGGITHDDLATVLRHVNPVEFQLMILNLEDRMLLWSRNTGSQSIYEPTPLTESLHDRGLLGPGCIVGAGKPVSAQSSNNGMWFNESFLTFMLGFLAGKPSLFRKEGSLHRRALQVLEHHFPFVFASGRGKEKMELAVESLPAMGLALREGDSLSLLMENWRALEKLEEHERRIVSMAALAKGSGWPLDTAIRVLRTVVHKLPADRSYSPDTLAMLFLTTALAVRDKSSGACGSTADIIDRLTLAGFFLADREGWLRYCPAAHEPAHAVVGEVRVTPAGDIDLQPRASLFCEIALSTVPERFDVTASFRLDKQRFLSGLALGLEIGKMFEQLERRSGHPLPSNLRTLITEWDDEYRSLSLRAGIVLQASGNPGHILTQTGVLDDFAFAHPAPNIWILDPRDETQWRRALAGVGIDRLPALGGTSCTPVPMGEADPAGRDSPGNGGRAVPSLDEEIDGALRSPALFSRENWTLPSFENPDSLFDELREAAGSVELDKKEREVFLERLHRRIILLPGQIRKGAWHYKVSTASGLDYQGKLRLAQSALASKTDKLAVTIPAGKELKTVMLFPHELRRYNQDYLLTGVSLPSNTKVQYTLREIGFLRRIQSSLIR